MEVRRGWEAKREEMGRTVCRKNRETKGYRASEKGGERWSGGGKEKLPSIDPGNPLAVNGAGARCSMDPDFRRPSGGSGRVAMEGVTYVFCDQGARWFAIVTSAFADAASPTVQFATLKSPHP